MSISFEKTATRDFFGFDPDGRVKSINGSARYVIAAEGPEDVARVDFVLNVLKSGDYRQGRLPSVEKVVFNGPATIVFWGDGDKTVVKNHGEADDREKALMAAALKKMLGNYTRFEKPFRKWLVEDDA